jgi:hypothetical protein
MTRIILFLTICWPFAFPAHAQDRRPDTSYYKSFSGSIIPRVFVSRNYSQLKFDPPGALPTMHFHANTPLNLGVGMAYKFISFSISKGLGFLQSASKKGSTKSFDLQTHIYRRKWVFDALAQFYQGYYLAEPNLGSSSGTGYYLRSDMRLRTVGITGYRVLNDRRFSYGSALGQGSIQERSAGSFLLGGNVFYTAINADSAFAPYKLDSSYSKQDIRKMHLFLFGPGIGYAYTYVYQKHYFLLGSVNVNLILNFSKELGKGIQSNKVDLSRNYIFRIGAGYNSNRWGVSLLWFTEGISAKGQHTGYSYAEQTGSYRLIFVRRIAVGRRMKDVLNQAEPGK